MTELSPSLVALLALVGFLTSVVGVVTGGNSLVNVPVMIWAGMAPRSAIATNMFALAFMTLSATGRFARARLIDARLVLPLGAITLATSAAGAGLTVVLPERALRAVIGASLAVMVVFMLARPRFGEVPAQPSGLRRALGYGAAALLGVYGGLFSGGYTTLLTFVCVGSFGIPLLGAVGLTKAVNLVSNVAASAVFLRAGVVQLRVAIPLSVAMLAGGWVGAHLAIERGQRFVRLLFVAVVAGLALKMVLVDGIGLGAG